MALAALEGEAMNDFINKYEAMAILCINCKHRHDCNDEMPCRERDLLLDAAVDAVPVVRCKDCKWYDRTECCNCKYMNDFVEDNDYCSFGERKDCEIK